MLIELDSESNDAFDTAKGLCLLYNRIFHLGIPDETNNWNTENTKDLQIVPTTSLNKLKQPKQYEDVYFELPKGFENHVITCNETVSPDLIITDKRKDTYADNEYHVTSLAGLDKFNFVNIVRVDNVRRIEKAMIDIMSMSPITIKKLLPVTKEMEKSRFLKFSTLARGVEKRLKDV